jgi:hypothetical protein
METNSRQKIKQLTKQHISSAKKQGNGAIRTNTINKLTL